MFEREFIFVQAKFGQLAMPQSVCSKGRRRKSNLSDEWSGLETQ
jgi:hypothetical protein